MYCLGIDVHKRDSYIAVLDDDGDVIEEVCIENANLDDFAQQDAGSEAAIEATITRSTTLSATILIRGC